MDEDQFFKEKTNSNIFKQIIYKYLPFWPFFVITVSISMFLAFVDLRSQVPVYIASAQGLLKDPQKNGGDSKVLDALNIFGEKKIVDNEIVVLRSPDLMQEVVKQLDLYATVYNKGNVRSEVENKMDIPILGELVQVKDKDPIVIMEGKRTVVAEQFRSIRTNLAFMGLNEKRNTLMISSSISGEGKSFVAINLAISFTLTGKKVALMEMDLRKPKLSKILKVKKTPGISSNLSGKASVDEIIKETEFPGLYIISAGPIPPNPTELIQGEEFEVLMTELKTRFDYIIMDTAPVSPVTDAQLLQKFADINLFVIRHAVTPRVFLSMIDALHKQKKFKNMYLVFNGIKPRGFNIYGYGFGGYGNGNGNGNGYGYGYGYG